VAFSPQDLKPPVLRQMKTLDERSELILQFSAKHYLNRMIISKQSELHYAHKYEIIPNNKTLCKRLF